MACGENFNTHSCVCDVLAEIAEVQQDTKGCLSSCSESIKELMGGVNQALPNTVPVQLICNEVNSGTPGTCGNVFLGHGFKRDPDTPGGLIHAASTFFRVSSVDIKNCCAELELLCAPGLTPAPNAVVCPPVAEVPTYTRTGICITVDLKRFSGVVCLPAATILAA